MPNARPSVAAAAARSVDPVTATRMEAAATTTQAFPAETTEAFCEGHTAAFRYFGGVPRSGNRRCLPVPCTGGDPAHTRAYLNEHREQLWAEAIHRVRENHETAYLPDSLKGAQSELTEQYRAVDEVAEEIIGEWLYANPTAVTANQVARGINWTPDSRSVYRITTVLKQMGYTRSMKRVRDAGSRSWMWEPPGGPAQLEL